MKYFSKLQMNHRTNKKNDSAFMAVAIVTLRSLFLFFVLSASSSSHVLLVRGFVPSSSLRTTGFIVPPSSSPASSSSSFSSVVSPPLPASSSSSLCAGKKDATEKSVTLEAKIDDEKVALLFAWVVRAFAGDPDYNNLMFAIVAIFGTDLPPDSSPMMLLQQARKQLLLHTSTDERDIEDITFGEPYSLDDREIASLGAMGAAQWTGQFQTRPHAILLVKNMTSIEEWITTLPRGCKRTIKKALQQNFTVNERTIVGGAPAPHSSLAHFRCVIAHEVRLLAQEDDVNSFFQALQVGISRYIGTTQMAGTIREYRDDQHKVIAIAHEVRKGSVIRGQWFYANDEAAKQYVWFHSVYDLVKRSIELNQQNDNDTKEKSDKSNNKSGEKEVLVDVVDLGPSGSDAFSTLKEKYGFLPIVEWTSVANYEGPFYYEDPQEQKRSNAGKGRLYEMQLKQQAAQRGNWLL